MSIKVMTYVWDHSPHTGSDLLMLLAIADHANDQGRAWPSIPTLAKKCRVLKRQAIRIIQHLEHAGSIMVQHGGGRGHPSIYTIKGVPEDTLCGKGALQDTLSETNGVLEDTVSQERVSSETPFNAERVSSRTRKGVLQDTRTIIEPSIRENPKPKTNARARGEHAGGMDAYTPGFLQFWRVYHPARRASKPSCQKLWLVANLEPRTDEICEKVERLKITSWREKEPTYIPMTLTWLNQGRYDDDLMPLPPAVMAGGRLSAREQRTAEASQRILEEMQHGSARPAGVSRRLE